MRLMEPIMILCDVIDNFGDIGFVYRLARRISEINPEIKLNLVVNNLKVFSKLCPAVDDEKSVQSLGNWKIYNWNDFDLCKREFSANIPLRILQCFQCTRPEWLEDIIFSKNLSDEIHMINVEYLTAEDWADDFHLLKSGTRRTNVKKINFMPGFTKKTGGLILDDSFMLFRKNHYENLKSCSEKCVRILLFSYPKNFSFLISALNRLFDEGVDVRLFVASGAGASSFLEQEKTYGAVRFHYEFLPYLSQIEWDEILFSFDFLLVRGEDSFSRACLSGIPFVWNIYPQDEQFHLVKLNAFLNRLNPDEVISRFSYLYNYSIGSALCDESESVVREIENLPETEDELNSELCDLLHEILCNLAKFKNTFKQYSDELISNGDMVEKLLEYMK